ncbi:MAG: radical SAM protein [Candidatus Omnitrophota bacterium]|nr:radical SAM protein [Candidatus Omnitrophota bacterium]
MDILLINSKVITQHIFDKIPPIGLVSIGNILEQHGFSVKILDLDILHRNFHLYHAIKNLSPKIVGISGTSHSRFESFRIAKIAKQVSSSIHTVYGGCHATFTAKDTLSRIPNIDYIVRGEGEITFLELAQYLLCGDGNIERINGISFRKEKTITCNPDRERISNLDTLSFSRHLIDMARYQLKLDFLNLPAISILTSRGCPWNCSFCSASAMFSYHCTTRSAKHIVNEIEYCQNTFLIKGVRFQDSTLTLNRSHIEALIQEMKHREIRIPWACSIRVDAVDQKLLLEMREAGCYYVSFAMESASEKVLRLMDKKITKEQVVNVLRECRNAGLKTKVFFSFGHIGETWKDTEETFRFIDQYIHLINLPAISLGILIYPGTYVEQYALKNNLLPEGFSWSTPITRNDKNFVLWDNVPKLLQPLWSRRELKQCYYRIIFDELKSVRRIKRRLREISSWQDVLKKATSLIAP